MLMCVCVGGGGRGGGGGVHTRCNMCVGYYTVMYDTINHTCCMGKQRLVIILTLPIRLGTITYSMFVNIFTF